MSPAALAFPQRRRLTVDVLAVGSLIGLIIRWLSLTLLAPIAVALLYGDSVWPFVVPLVGGFVIGYGIERACGRRAGDVDVREAFAVVAITWIAAMFLGATPYMVEGGDIAGLVDATFETMSGFTTTGASVMSDIPSHSRAILFWRGLTQWLGGMGIIVLALAVLGSTGPGGRALMEREAPGPEVDKLTPRLRDTAMRLWLVYIGLSVLMVLLLVGVGLVDAGQGMGLYNAVTHTFTAMSTGGFSPEARSMEVFGPIAQTITVVFMIIAGANFALWYRAAIGDIRTPLRDGELRVYLGILAGASLLVAVGLLATSERDVWSSLGQATFQVVSVMTTTGFASQDFASWTSFALLILFATMFIGGCAGSTAGAIKVIRVRLAFGGLRRDIETAVHPEAILPVRVTGVPVRESAIQGATVFAGLYVATFAAGTALILLIATLHGFELGAFDSMVAAATTLGNVGPGVGVAGPMGSFATYPWEAKVVMTVLMWIGRLEIIPVFVLATRAYWVR